MVSSRQPSVPVKLRPTYDAIVALTDAVCHEHLNDEYAELSRELAATLARKRPSPLERGQHKTWACGIVYTIGWVNFLSDPARTPHMTLSELCKLFGVGASTGTAKSAEIRRLLRIHQLEPQWTLPSLADNNPLIWMLQVNGYIMDIRDAPREAQEEALRRGLIPYIPEPRGEG